MCEIPFQSRGTNWNQYPQDAENVSVSVLFVIVKIHCSSMGIYFSGITTKFLWKIFTVSVYKEKKRVKLSLMFQCANVLKESLLPFFMAVSHPGSLSHESLHFQCPYQPGQVILQVSVCLCWHRTVANKPVCLAFGLNQWCHSSLKYSLPGAPASCWARGIWN